MNYRELDFTTESDVEQKFLYKLLTSDKPYGLNYDDTNILTKPDIRKIKIDKGTTSKYYFPDYVLINHGLPSLIVEAKNPNEDLVEAYREARLYANEINSSFPNKINPCIYIIASNGKQLIAGHWDTETPLFNLKQENYNISDEAFSVLINDFSNEKIDSEIDNIKKKYRGESKFIKPRYMLGGKSSRNISRGENSFGINLALEFKYLFNPETENEREEVIKNAYVESKRRLAHVLPIDRLIRNVITPSKNESLEISNTKAPKEIFNQLKQKDKIKNQICLLIGSVGSGKSTFIDYLHKIALPKDLTASTFWLSVNLNLAPINKEKIYSWFSESAIETLKSKNPQIDFNELSFIKKVFHKEIKAKSSVLGLLGEGSTEYNKELYNIIKSLKDDNETFLKALIQYLFINKNILPIIVLDNCDKRTRDEQLLMFDVANYIKNNFNVMVVLPLRETTFDLYKNEPPLDTVIKDLVFRIDPPLLVNVIKKRIEYALRELSENQKDFNYSLSNGLIVKCKSEDVSNYLKSILHTLFQNDFFRKLMIGLTGRNIRKGLEIFLEFCKSGHLSEDEILKMRTSQNSYEVPNHLITRILLRGKREYYDESSSRIKNIFSSDTGDTLPDPFIRLSILHWLKERQRVPGPTKVKGYHKTIDLEKYLISIGHLQKTVKREIEFLLFENCIISESQDSKYDSDNLISITSSGIILLELLNNIDYLATVSEDTFFRNIEKSQIIANNMTGKSRFSPMSKQASLNNADTLLKYLKNYKNEFWFTPEPTLAVNDKFISSSLTKGLGIIQRSKTNDPTYIDVEILKSNHPIDSIQEGLIVSIQHYGIFVELGLNATGLIHISNLEGIDFLEHYEVGDRIDVRILELNEQKGKFSLALDE
ncbi:S1 RNA-binding domain-containing protein [Winogradskyella sediminis]|uniref:Type I restriction enzyme R protein N terminus (HSDR_N) n=1 Tax=Winogradskyella sediminis TaxID=1382466 RepID=A0A1H1LXT5_9FLAO|nr:S1 RNA-binding domain-containing protein [Winogradskyella sediminis]SDR79311.1 Type I restriction enzyme R protein N terminus (HSDR_N) [Winogradskyella sediminis]